MKLFKFRMLFATMIIAFVLGVIYDNKFNSSDNFNASRYLMLNKDGIVSQDSEGYRFLAKNRDIYLEALDSSMRCKEGIMSIDSDCMRYSLALAKETGRNYNEFVIKAKLTRYELKRLGLPLCLPDVFDEENSI